MFSNNTTFNGVRVFALPRLDMINGVGAPNAGAVAFTITAANIGDAYSLVPATFRAGSPPPAGTDQYFLAIDSPGSAGVSLTQVHAWRFHVDFTTPANSTFGVGAAHTPNAEITVAPFVDAFTTATAIVPQPVTTARLDTLGDKLMTPLVYQNLGGVESLYVSHTVNNNQGGTGPTAIRWYQFDVTGGTIPATPVQQQTFNNAADGIWRFQPAIAVDGDGNLAIAYSASSTATEPSIRYAGRKPSDPLNTMAQGEAVLQAGGGHQTSTSGRWGDYTALSIDPTDNATFWNTHEYYSATTGSAWNTRIGKFKFPAAPTATSVVSRKTHGTMGPFDIPLPSTGNPGIESRTGAVAGEHQIVASFAGTVTVASASVTAGTGSVDNFSVSGGDVTINLTGVTDAQVVTVKLTNVNDGTNSGDVTVRMAVLLGDVYASGGVNGTDVGQTKLASGQQLTPTTFRADVNASGQVGTDRHRDREDGLRHQPALGAAEDASQFRGGKARVVTRQRERKIRVVKRIAQERVAVHFLHVGGLAKKLRFLRVAPLMAARNRFVMNEIGVGRPDDLIAGLRDAQTVIDVVKIHAQRALESAHFLEDAAPRQHAGGGHGRAVALQNGAIEIARLPARQTQVRVTGHAAQAEDDSAVLQRAIGIPEARADRAHLGPRRVAHHFRQPARVRHFDVVIQESQDVAAGLRPRPDCLAG